MSTTKTPTTTPVAETPNTATLEVPKVAVVAINATGCVIKLVLTIPWVICREVAKAIIKCDKELTS